MGIYISGVKGLPEQVQENKNKIKEVEEQIEGIDFEAVRELQGQVAENTQDINNLEASIGVQNQAINGLKDRADALESKTQKITYDEDTGKTTIDSYTIINGDVDCDNVAVAGNGTFQNANGSGLHFQEGPNDDEVALTNREGQTPHYLTITADGNLTFDDQPVGNTYYQHHITWATGSNYGAELVFDVVNTDRTLFTATTFCAYLNDKGIINTSTALKMNNIILNAIDNTLYFLTGFYRYSANSIRIQARKTDGSSSNITVDSLATFIDTLL